MPVPTACSHTNAFGAPCCSMNNGGAICMETEPEADASTTQPSPEPIGTADDTERTVSAME